MDQGLKFKPKYLPPTPYKPPQRFVSDRERRTESHIFWSHEYQPHQSVGPAGWVGKPVFS